MNGRHSAPPGGLQATDSASTAVYVSAGGDPFFEGEQKTYTTDGFPALARMVIIAGQELGHFADLRRTSRGIIGRFSTDANASQLRADPIAREAWLRDRATVSTLKAAYDRAGLPLLRRAEKGVTFYHAKRRYSPPWLFYQFLRLIAIIRLFKKATYNKLCLSFKIIPYSMLGESIEAYLSDMEYNLAPDADDYKHPDPLIEEAILVIEAVARVPQQAYKWNHRAVMQAWPNLYRFYFDGIITSCRQVAVQPLRVEPESRLRRILVAIKRRWRARPGYYP